MIKNKICMGIWGMTNLRDRFNVQGFGEEVSVIERIKKCGQTEGVEGIELHVPTEINKKSASEIEKVLKDSNLRMVMLCGHTWVEKQYKFGALGNSDNKIRTNAINRVKEALDMGTRFGISSSVLWPATDGNDFPLQTIWPSMTATSILSARFSTTSTRINITLNSASSPNHSNLAPIL